MYGDRFRAALSHAAELHASQVRKGSGVPYVSHLLSVTALVIEHGGDEDQAIAALLHDAVEDQGGLPVLEDIRARYGPRVAGIVEACTDTKSWPKPPWRERKEAYLATIPRKSDDAVLVSMADKLHNARTIIEDYRYHGESLWGRFRGQRDGTLWYYRALVDAFAGRPPARLHEELGRTVDAMWRMANGG